MPQALPDPRPPGPRSPRPAPGDPPALPDSPRRAARSHAQPGGPERSAAEASPPSSPPSPSPGSASPSGADAATGSPLALPLLLLVLTFATGVVDAVSFIGLGRVFTALMTGNVVFTAFALLGVEGLSAARSLAALAAFLLGALVAGRVARAFVGRSHRRWLGVVATLEVSALLAGAGFGVGYDVARTAPASSLYGVIAATAFAMGVRNATVLRLAVPDLKTTVMTLTLTGMAADSRLAGGASPRLGWRVASVLSLFAGAAVGAWLVRGAGVSAPLLLVAGLVAGATLLYARTDAADRLATDPKARKTPARKTPARETPVPGAGHVPASPPSGGSAGSSTGAGGSRHEA